LAPLKKGEESADADGGFARGFKKTPSPFGKRVFLFSARADEIINY